MGFRITITADAEAQMQALPVHDRRALEAAIQARLQDLATTPTCAIKLLRPNPLAQFELRVGDLRVLYNVENDEVVLLIMGRKEGNKLIVAGKEFHAHQEKAKDESEDKPDDAAQDDSAQPTGGERPRDAE